MGNVIQLSERHARVSAGSRAARKSPAVNSPFEASTIRPTRPSEGICKPASILEREAFDASTIFANSSRLISARSRYDLSGCFDMLNCYMERNKIVKAFVAPGATTAPMNRGTLWLMSKSSQGQHYIRQWRKKRNLSLRALASRLEYEPGGEPLVTYASLSRIENGEQPFSEPVLNAIADALQVTRSMLLEMNPEKEGHVVDLLNKMDGPTRDQAIRMLELMVRSSAA